MYRRDDIDYYVEVNMAGFASIINAVGGVHRRRRPHPAAHRRGAARRGARQAERLRPGGRAHLDGDEALWFARSRRDSDDYNRMGRQRCLLQSLLQQKSPTDVISHFQAISAATTNSVSTNVPQEVLGSLVAWPGASRCPCRASRSTPTCLTRTRPTGTSTRATSTSATCARSCRTRSSRRAREADADDRTHDAVHAQRGAHDRRCCHVSRTVVAGLRVGPSTYVGGRPRVVGGVCDA